MWTTFGWRRWWALPVVGLVGLGCTGEFTDSAASGPTPRQNGTGGSLISPSETGGQLQAGSQGGGGTHVVPRPVEETGFTPGDEAAHDLPAVTTRFARLTHTQWQNSVRDLLRLDDTDDAPDSTQLLREDPRQAGFLFDNDGSALVVDEALLGGYERAASELAAWVAQDSGRLSLLVPTAAADAGAELSARRDAFIEAFAERAHRHSVGSGDIALYRTLFDAAPNLYDIQDEFTAGVRAVVEASLQSPYFLYRVEESQALSGSVIPLNGYEVAVRLSYALWNTMPDDALFAAAESGALTQADELEAQARRMLSDDRAAAVLLSFHDQLLDAAKFANIAPSDTFFSVSSELKDHARTEQTLFIEDTLFTQQGSVRDLFTSRDTFVNDELAEIYGLTGNYGETFQRASLDADTRAGIFSHVGFLASNATSADPDPIHRGKFLAERIACISIAAPPVDIPAPPKVSDKTNRERIEEFTEADGSACAACHKPLINPFGFPFESFDAIGAYRDTDQGLPVRTDATPLLDGSPTPVADAVELANAMANSEGVHGCYTKHALEFLYGRPEAASDTGLVERVAALSHGDDQAVVDLFLNLIKTEAFLTRSTEEEL